MLSLCSIDHIRNGFNAAVRVGRKTCKVIFRLLCPEIIQHQERVKLRDLVTAKCPVQADTGTFDSHVCPEDAFDCPNLCHNEETGSNRSLTFGLVGEIFVVSSCLSVLPVNIPVIMGLKDQLEGIIPDDVLCYLSDRFDVIGSIAVLCLPPPLADYKTEIAQAILSRRK